MINLSYKLFESESGRWEQYRCLKRKAKFNVKEIKSEKINNGEQCSIIVLQYRACLFFEFYRKRVVLYGKDRYSDLQLTIFSSLPNGSQFYLRTPAKMSNE